MPIITSLYFNSGVKNIPNISADAVAEGVDEAILIYEPEYLQKVLGYPLFAAFDTGRLAEEPEDRWVKLLSGSVFEYGGVQIKWQGFQNEITYQSPIADYVMAKWAADESSNNTGIGESISKGIHAESASALPRVVANWNRMYEKNCILAAFIRSSGLYPEYDGNVDRDLFRPLNALGI